MNAEPTGPAGTPGEVAALVERCVSAWPTGTRGRIWTESFTACTLPHTALVAAFEHLRDNATRPPTPGEFLDVARQLNRKSTPPPRPADSGPPASRADVIARLEWRVSTGSATAADIEALEGLYAVARHHEPDAVQPTLTEGADTEVTS